MEADEEERELGDLCAEILENWNTPIYSETEIMHQNPFTLNPPPTMDSTVETKPKRKYKDLEFDEPIIPRLVADTFYDKLLGHSTDGIDIAALTCEAKVEDGARTTTVSANKTKEAAPISSVHIHQNMNNITNLHCNRLPKLSPISGEYRCTAASTEFKRWMAHKFIRKLQDMLYANKTINIDDFGEKTWRNPGVDTTDFFNYGLDEKQWNDYYREMQTLIHGGSSGPSKTSSDTSSNSIDVAL